MAEKSHFKKSGRACNESEECLENSDRLFDIIKQGNYIIVAFKKSCMNNIQDLSETAEIIKQYIQVSDSTEPAIKSSQQQKIRPQRIIFDFTAVKFFSSGLLGLLLDVRNKVQEYGGEVMISGINPQLHRVFKITNLDKIFRFFANWQQAVDAKDSD